MPPVTPLLRRDPELVFEEALLLDLIEAFDMPVEPDLTDRDRPGAGDRVGQVADVTLLMVP